MVVFLAFYIISVILFFIQLYRCNRAGNAWSNSSRYGHDTYIKITSIIVGLIPFVNLAVAGWMQETLKND